MRAVLASSLGFLDVTTVDVKTGVLGAPLFVDVPCVSWLAGPPTVGAQILSRRFHLARVIEADHRGPTEAIYVEKVYRVNH